MAKKENSEKLNIAMLGQKRIPSREGGVEIVVEELATRMSALGHNVTCYNRGGHHVSGKEYDKAELKEYKGVRLKKLLTIDFKGLAAASSSVFGAIMVALGKYDVVHFHAEGPCVACFLPKLFGKKVIATIHGLDHKRAKWGRFASTYIMMGEKAAVKHADEIIVLSKDVQDYFKRTYNRETVLIPNGVSRYEKRAASIITEKWELNRDDYILFLGRIVPEKGIHYLIKAYKELLSEKESGISGRKLVIAGGTSDTSEYMQEVINLADAKWDEKKKCYVSEDGNIIFTDFVQGETLEELYSNAYVYVLPSDLEGMPLSLLEAMSYGNACLTSDIAECADVLCDKGVIFKHGDIVSLRDALRNLTVNPDKVNELKAQAADYICEKYNWDEVVDSTLSIYRK